MTSSNYWEVAFEGSYPVALLEWLENYEDVDIEERDSPKEGVRWLFALGAFLDGAEDVFAVKERSNLFLTDLDFILRMEMNTGHQLKYAQAYHWNEGKPTIVGGVGLVTEYVEAGRVFSRIATPSELRSELGALARLQPVREAIELIREDGNWFSMGYAFERICFQQTGKANVW